MKLARLGVLIEKKTAERNWQYGINVFERYIGEILGYAGISFQWIDSVHLVAEQTFDVVIAARVDETEATASILWNYVEQGGTVISYGGVQVLAAKLGYLYSNATGVGYAKLGDAYSKAESIRFLNAIPWKDFKGTHTCEEFGELYKDKPIGVSMDAAHQKFAVGKGALHRFAVDIVGTIVGLQQGTRPVLQDGVPAPDGSAQLNEGILKAEDQLEVDWQWDRLFTETGNPYMAYPYADYWREILIGHLLQVVVEKGLTLPFLDVWPEGINRVATISHDSDENQDVHAESTLSILNELGIQSTWCMLEPGYSPEIYERVKEAGHELAFHYNALEMQGGKWGEEEFARQFQWLQEATGLEVVTSNKNHYTRFEGFGELFAFCEKHGIQSDQTRGPSKKGSVGFLFGTCHPFFPISWADENNRIYDVLEICFLTQDLDLSSHWSDSSIIIPFLERVMQVDGIAHFLTHQIHLHNSENVRNALRKIVKEARERGFEFWTGKQINDWHRYRRSLEIVSMDEHGNIQFKQLSKHTDQPEVVVWIPLPSGNVLQPDELTVTRYGVNCIKRPIQN